MEVVKRNRFVCIIIAAVFVFTCFAAISTENAYAVGKPKNVKIKYKEEKSSKSKEKKKWIKLQFSWSKVDKAKKYKYRWVAIRPSASNGGNKYCDWIETTKTKTSYKKTDSCFGNLTEKQ